MFEEIWSTLESLRPQAEMHESTADIIRIRPETVREGMETVGLAIGAMLGGVQEQVNTIAETSDAILSDTVLLATEAQIAREAATKTREMAAGNELELGLPDRIDTSMIDAMALETETEDALAEVVSLADYRQTQQRMADEARAFLIERQAS